MGQNPEGKGSTSEFLQQYYPNTKSQHETPKQDKTYVELIKECKIYGNRWDSFKLFHLYMSAKKEGQLLSLVSAINAVISDDPSLTLDHFNHPNSKTEQ